MRISYKEKIEIDGLFIFIGLFILMINSVLISVSSLIISMLLFSTFFLVKILFCKEISRNLNLFFIFFGIYILIRILLSNLVGYYKIIDLSAYLLFIVIQLTFVKNYKILVKSYKFILVVGILNFIFVLYQFFSPMKYQQWILSKLHYLDHATVVEFISYDLYFGVTNQPAHLAGIFVLCLGICILTKDLIIKNTIFRYSLAIMFFIGLVAAAKRAHLLFGITSIILIIIFILILTQSKRILTKVYLSINLAVIVVAILAIGSFQFFKNIMIFNEIKDTFKGIVEGVDVTNGRSSLYTFTMNYFYENPIWGNGWKFISQNSYDSAHTHSIYIQVLAELGLIGFIFFIGFILWNFMVSFKICVSMKNEQFVPLIYIAIFYQIFFVLYGFTGNLITDYNYLLMYGFFICVVNSLSALKSSV